jgi:hypothetical protein
MCSPHKLYRTILFGCANPGTMATDPDYDEALALAEQSLGRVDPSRRTARRLRPRTLKVATGSSEPVPSGFRSPRSHRRAHPTASRAGRHSIIEATPHWISIWRWDVARASQNLPGFWAEITLPFDGGEGCFYYAHRRAPRQPSPGWQSDSELSFAIRI